MGIEIGDQTEIETFYKLRSQALYVRDLEVLSMKEALSDVLSKMFGGKK